MPSRDAFPPEPGTTLEGRFVVERVLGSGGMGVVVSAQHLGLQRLVAVKLLRPEFIKSPTVVHRFLREARAVARLKSEHVVDVLDAGMISMRQPYFVMEHLAGTDLGNLVQRYGPLDVDDVIDYALQTLEALAEAHRRGVVHRDLKPTNLFLTTREDGSGLVKVLDFGVSKLIDWEVTGDGVVTRQGTTLGSPRYMSPEQIQDASQVDARSDIWSFGAVMHELLSGSPLFDAPAMAPLIRSICTRPYEPPNRDDLPPALAEILALCMKKNVKERFSNVEHLARAFQPLAHKPAAQVSIDRILRRVASAPPPHGVDERPSLPSITPITADSTLPSMRKRRRVRVVVASLVVAGLVAAFSLGRLRRDNPPVLASPAAPVVGVTVVAPIASIVSPEAVGERRPEPSTASPRRTSSTKAPDRSSATPAANATSRSTDNLPPHTVTKVRPLDTVNPFVKGSGPSSPRR